LRRLYDLTGGDNVRAGGACLLTTQRSRESKQHGNGEGFVVSKVVEVSVIVSIFLFHCLSPFLVRVFPTSFKHLLYAPAGYLYQSLCQLAACQKARGGRLSICLNLRSFCWVELRLVNDGTSLGRRRIANPVDGYRRMWR
jgi:hypothetical protein